MSASDETRCDTGTPSGSLVQSIRSALFGVQSFVWGLVPRVTQVSQPSPLQYDHLPRFATSGAAAVSVRTAPPSNEERKECDEGHSATPVAIIAPKVLPSHTIVCHVETLEGRQVTHVRHALRADHNGLLVATRAGGIKWELRFPHTSELTNISSGDVVIVRLFVSGDGARSPSSPGHLFSIFGTTCIHRPANQLPLHTCWPNDVHPGDQIRP